MKSRKAKQREETEFHEALIEEKTRRNIADDETGTLAARLGGDLEAEVRDALLSRETPSARAAVKAEAEKIRRSLARPNQTEIENRLISRIVINWIDLHLADGMCSRTIGQIARGCVLELDFLDRRRLRAEKRYLNAIKALDLIRERAIATARAERDEQAKTARESAKAKDKAKAKTGRNRVTSYFSTEPQEN
ncbi:hypothetical protein SAMN05444166_0142 [Singulisphaera sp. GP187]|uniref:hypothetical protein n=1 Tax=Singulisphaera sp. GP187 TaxID=1882752 RepID=UPI000928AA8D|nr:hypothetical protein [Singulisphaera sp. GP187]SIN69025.1 hypothetical protein SAMN05444166_0142 [Singulisphaera sp. GP187]